MTSVVENSMNLMRAVQKYTLFSVSQDITLTPNGVISYNWTVPDFSESVQGLALFSTPLLLRQDEASMSIMLTKDYLVLGVICRHLSN